MHLSSLNDAKLRRKDKIYFYTLKAFLLFLSKRSLRIVFIKTFFLSFCYFYFLKIKGFSTFRLLFKIAYSSTFLTEQTDI